jgi:hypothetical protein
MKEVIDVAQTLGVALAEVLITMYVCITYIKKRLHKPDVSKNIPLQNQIDIDIMTKMDYAKELLNADRIHIYEFHNGEHYSDYRSAYKFSCSYEAIKAGKVPLRNKCTNLPISVMPKFINKITSEGYFACEDISKLKDDMPSTHAFKRELGVKAFYDIAIRNVSGNIIGFVAIQWDKGTTQSINEDEIKKLVWFIEERLRESIELSK